MSDNSPKLGLPYIQPAQAQKHITHNEAVEKLDALTQLVVSSFDASTPPQSPQDGETFAIGGSPTGDWASNPNQVGFFSGGGWLFFSPQVGWRAWGKAENELRTWDGDAWVSVVPSFESVELLGINASADTHNRLSVSSEATLLNNAGSSHQLKINKSASSDTASLLFQSGWTGHAEMGLTGDTDFSLKVSADGGNWITPLTIKPASQRIEFAPGGSPNVVASNSSLKVDVPITGTAVQNGQNDPTSAKLMKVGAFGLGAAPSQISNIDVVDGSIQTGFYKIDGATIGAPRSSGTQHLLHSSHGANGESQLVMIQDDGSLFCRSRSGGAWQAWQQIATSDHLTGDMNDPELSPVFERGNNGGGEYTRFADGTQICWHDLTLSYNWERELYGSWIFPAAFSSNAKVFCSVDFNSLDTNATPDVDSISAATVEGASATGAQFRLIRSAGQTDFAASDTAVISTLAFGRWK